MDTKLIGSPKKHNFDHHMIDLSEVIADLIESGKLTGNAKEIKRQFIKNTSINQSKIDEEGYGYMTLGNT